MKTYDRPKLDIPKTMFERIMDGAAIGAFFGIVVYLVSAWGVLPEQVPAHYNAAGEVDRWGSKWELVMLPVIAALLWVGMTFLEKHPEWHNYMALNERNIEFQYRNSRLMLNVLKNLIVPMFAYLSYRSTKVALGEADSLGVMFLPIFLVLMIAPLIIFITRSLRNR
ncbi:DUF1648 domain-containing protein [Bhargavaea beijingensis]|uniref:DUF1648 domain-containing protein n=1 Tax=Bhargavaea beijingensis TaxID=426756 RepID=A0A1G7GGR1_9BACL|nr:DUF1648 domain-containing protein [Bhargavaea beijingensis]RSK29730.1 DUF1648 domain-containing protein [Bhargavaea beijingensis]SDE87352.1 Protein of unknown function [Bhargavaea beijingensis]